MSRWTVIFSKRSDDASPSPRKTRKNQLRDKTYSDRFLCIFFLFIYFPLAFSDFPSRLIRFVRTCFIFTRRTIILLFSLFLLFLLCTSRRIRIIFRPPSHPAKNVDAKSIARATSNHNRKTIITLPGRTGYYRSIVHIE